MSTDLTNEIELKVLEVDLAKAISRLELLGAKKVLDTITYIYSFDIEGKIQYRLIPDHLLSIVKKAESLVRPGRSLRGQNFHLRARKQEEQYEFTLKYHLGKQARVKKEIEMSIELDSPTWRRLKRILIRAGLKLIAEQEKKRISYIILEDNVRFDLDTWPGIPTYLEIEAPSEEKIYEYIDKLGLGDKEQSALSGERLFDRYGVLFYSRLTFKG